MSQSTGVSREGLIGETNVFFVVLIRKKVFSDRPSHESGSVHKVLTNRVSEHWAGYSILLPIGRARILVGGERARRLLIVPSAVGVHRVEALLFRAEAAATVGGNAKDALRRGQVQRVGRFEKLHVMHNRNGRLSVPEWAELFDQASLLGHGVMRKLFYHSVSGMVIK
jgi:hypothetical protein